MNIIGIYGIENRIENKWYVGQSINLYKRLGGHIDRLRRGDHPLLQLQADYDRLGRDSFEVHVLEFCDLDNLNERECFWIKEKDAVKNGYCTSTGGYGGSGVKWSEEAKCRLSERRQGHTVSQEARDKISQTNKGRKPGFGGRCHTDEVKEKIAQSKRGVPRPQHVIDTIRRANMGKIPINAMKIINVETGEIFSSIKKAADSIGVNRSSLSEALKEHRTCGGHLFAYVEEIERGVDKCG